MKSVKNIAGRLLPFLLLSIGRIGAQGQGTITFDHALYGGTNYSQLGMQFHVIIPTRGSGSPNYDNLGVDSGSLGSTFYMIFFQQFSPDDYVGFSLTNGYSFGLTSVQLADPNSPSSSLVPISFVGFLSNGSSVTNTFTTPGGATTFQNYLFTSAFASGLTSVDIFAPRWAMDNLVFGNVTVPEPGAVSLLLVGLLGVVDWRIRIYRFVTKQSQRGLEALHLQ